MEESPIEEQITNENFKEFLTSKVFKKRVAAYKEINQYPEFISLVQNETLAVALEPALTSLLQFKGTLSNNEINNLYLQFTQTKQAVKTLLSDLIDKVFDNDKIGVVKGLTSNLSHKNAKVVCGCVMKLKSLLMNNNEFFNSKEGKNLLIEIVCPQLETIFASADKDVKAEGSVLVLEIFKILFEVTLKFLENVKPIILKDLKELFSTVEIPSREVKISDLEFDHSDWKERLSALNYLKENIANMSNKNEVYSILFRKTKDPNIQVVLTAVECIKRGMINYPDCIRGIIDRFKDKKAPLTALIKETIQAIQPDINILIDSLEVKNPDIKIGILECLKCYTRIIRASDIGKLLEDSSADVRRIAAEVLNQMENLEGLSEVQLSKLKRKVTAPVQEAVKVPISNSPVRKISNIQTNNPSPNKNSIKSNGSSISNSESPSKKLPSYLDAVKNIEILNSSNFEFVSDQASKNRINDDFIQKFPFLLEKDWSKKLEAINNSTKQIKGETPLSIVLYLICSKETNFHIFKAFMNILESYNDISSTRTPLVAFLNSKITESKLKDSMIVLYRKLDQNFIVQNFIYCLKNNKTGKRLLTFLEFFILILKGKNPLVDQFLDEFRVIGIQEKKALNSFIDEYNKLGTSENPKNNGGNTDTTRSNAEYSHSIQNEMTPTTVASSNSKNFDKKLPISNIVPLDHKNSTLKIFTSPINHSQIKNCHVEPSKVFTPEFLDLFEKDISKAVKILESQNLVLISDIVISLYCSYSVPSTYFNSLILHFITNKYILQEQEAIYLANYLVENLMETELELMDRIYPATKLYKAFRAIENENRFKAIYSLICKYKNLKDLKCNEIQKIVNENEDFIGFSIEVEKILKMKQELRMKYENSSYSSNYDAKECDEDNIKVKDTCAVPIFNIYSESKSKEESTNVIKLVSPMKVNNDKRNEDSIHCLNSNEDQIDINDLEDSIIIEATPSLDQCSPDPRHSSATVIIAPTVADIDGLTGEYSNNSDGKKTRNESEFITFDIPDTSIEAQDVFDHDIERSLENISISTTPQKKKRHFDPTESLLEKIFKGSDSEAITGLENLIKIFSNDYRSLLPSCNSIVSTLLETLKMRYSNVELRNSCLSILLKFTQLSEMCSSINYEALVSVNTVLIPLVKDNVIIADILINLCLNCDLQILRVYFDLLNNNDEILMKLIWRHSKKVNYSSAESVAVVVRIVDAFYQSKRDFLHKAENIVLKVCLLHLKECIVVFSDNIKEFGISEITNSIVQLLISSKDLNLDAIRAIFRN